MKIVGIPFSGGNFGRNKGCAGGPNSVLKCLEEVWASENGVGFDVADLNYVECSVENVVDGDVYLGGDHTVSYHTFKKFCEGKVGKEVGLLVFDAHPDVFLEKGGGVNHQNWLGKLIEEGVVGSKNVVLVGIRSFHPWEKTYLRKKGIKFFEMKNIFNNVEYSCDGVMESVRGFKELYISVDVDCVDPAFAPGTGCIEPCGMSSRDLIYFLQRIKKIGNISCLDVVEINPEKDVNEMTSKLGAKIVVEVCS